jgi:hypothetical protein
MSGLQMHAPLVPLLEAVAEAVAEAANNIRTAMTPKKEDHTARPKACAALQRAIDALKGYLDSARTIETS